MTDAVIILDSSCPFCGVALGKCNVVEVPLKPPVFIAHVWCVGCNTHGPQVEAPERVVAAAHAFMAWNRRFSSSPEPSSS